MSTQIGKSATRDGLVFHTDMWNTKKSWMGAPTSNIIYTTPLTISTYAQCTGPVATNTYDEAGRPITANRYTIITSPSAARAAVWYSSLVIGKTYSFSCKLRYNGTNTTSPSLYVDASKGSPEAGGGNTFTNISATFTPIGGNVYLVKYTFTVSASPTLGCVLCWGVWTNGGAAYVGNTFDSWDEQFEVQAFPTRFVKGSRAANASIIDLAGGGPITPTSLTYSPSGTYSFNGTTDQISISVPVIYRTPTNSVGRSWEVIAKPAALMSNAGIFGLYVGSSYFTGGGICIWAGYYSFCWYDNTAYQWLSSAVTPTSGTYVHIVGVWDGVALLPRIYINGVLAGTWSTASNMSYGTPSTHLIGFFGSSGYPFNGEISVAKYYHNKALSASEISNSFESYRGRYGL